MHNTSPHFKRKGPAAMLGLHRVLTTMVVASAFALLISIGWTSSFQGLLWRTYAIGFTAMLIFGVFERWPKKLPRWLARWVLQVIGVAAIIPVTVTIIYLASTPESAPHFWHDSKRMAGFFTLTFTGILIAPWVALAALVRQKEALARHQALAFELERSELEHQALEARHRLLQAQVSPHFLFNTLANIQALVDTGSPKAAEVLSALVAYLRAAVPRLNETSVTIEREQQMVTAYLELMQMRMPDRLSFSIDVDRASLTSCCPPMTLMTLVENAIRHGIDPSEEGGHISVNINRIGNRCQICVSDTGVGLAPNNTTDNVSNSGLGSGLTTLRERLKLTFNSDAKLSLTEQQPHGVRVEVDFPARQS